MIFIMLTGGGSGRGTAGSVCPVLLSVLIPVSVLFIKYYPDLGRYYGRWDYHTFYCGVTTNKQTPRASWPCWAGCF